MQTEFRSCHLQNKKSNQIRAAEILIIDVLGFGRFSGLFSHPDTPTLPLTKQYSQCNQNLKEELLFQLQIRVMSIRGTILEAAGVEDN